MLFNCVSISWSGTDGDFEASNREASSSWWRRGAAQSDHRKTTRDRHSAFYVCPPILGRGDDDRHHVHLIGKEKALGYRTQAQHMRVWRPAQHCGCWRHAEHID